MLLTTDAEGAGDFEKACRDMAAGRIGSGIVIVLSDFLFKAGLRQRPAEADRRAIRPLRDPGASARRRLRPTLTGDLKLLDVEDGDAAEITVSAALLKYYKKNLAAYCDELNDFCTRRGAVYVLANSADSVESLVLNYLRRIHLLR